MQGDMYGIVSFRKLELFSSALIGGLEGIKCIQIQHWTYWSLQKDISTFNLELEFHHVCNLHVRILTYMHLLFNRTYISLIDLLMCVHTVDNQEERKEE